MQKYHAPLDIREARPKTQSISEQLRQVPQISQTTVADKDTFNKLLIQNTTEENTDYGNSWSYILQGTFFGSYKYYDGKTILAITTRYPGKTPFVIVKAAGKNYIEKIAEIATKLRAISGERVIVKNLNSDEFKKLQNFGFTDYLIGDCWSERFKYDDDTYPEAIVHIPTALALKGSKFKLLKYRINALRRRHRILVEKYTPIIFADGIKVWQKWSASFVKRFEKELKANPLDAHSIDLHKTYVERLSSIYDGKNVFSYMLYIDGEPHAFTLAEKVSPSTIGFYSNISSNTHQGLSELLLYEAFARALQAGFTYANLGGSEFESLFNFKKKFAPKLVQKTHAILY